jgi:hypothetical protein
VGIGDAVDALDDGWLGALGPEHAVTATSDSAHATAPPTSVLRLRVDISDDLSTTYRIGA